jgi:lipoyl(octanoyl) transferase
MEFTASAGPIEYLGAVQTMERRVADIHAGTKGEQVWLVEHPPLYTAGTSAKPEDLLNPQFPVFETGRGGQFTYHGPGQRVAYVMLDLKKRQKVPDIKRYVCQLESWIIGSLSAFGVNGERREGRVGIWVDTPTGEKKIAAVGVRIRHWVTYHGVSINVSPDLSHFSGIVPCGISEFGVTSLHDLGKNVSMQDLDDVLTDEFVRVFG